MRILNFFPILAIFILTGIPSYAASLTPISTTQVSTNNANFDISVFPGNAKYNDRGIGGSEPGAPTFQTTLGDGTVLSYNFVGNSGAGSNLTTYASTGTRTPTPVKVGPTASTHGNGEDWANVWTTSDPGVGLNFSGSTKNHNPTGVAGAANTFARVVAADGTVDISGLSSGQLYFPIGTFNNGWTLTLTMTGAGQTDITAVDSEGGIGNNNRGYISEFNFTNEGQYDTISYEWRHQDLDASPGSRARFMGVILDGSAAPTAPPVVINSGASGITATSATVAGEVTDNGGVNPTVTIYWGDNDGGTTPGSWDNSVILGTQGGLFSTNLSGLNSSTTYYFRSFASNGAGDDWANSTSSFTTAAPPTPPTIINTPATNVSFEDADINGTVTSTGSEDPTVTLYFGDNDGGTTPGSWDDSVNIGTQSGNFSNSLSFLTSGTTYYFRAFAQNSGGSAWAPSTASFTTQAYALPTLTNSPASNITGRAAQVGGEVTSTGGDSPTITIYYGDNDGGSTIGNWDSSVSLGDQISTFSTTLSSLNPLTTYYFRALAVNGAGSIWATPTETFTTLEAADFIINEFMAANDGGTTNNPNSWYPIANQVGGATDDWIEILNTSGSTLDIGGWHLTDDGGNLTKWTFPPSTNLNDGEFLIVYASNDNAPDANGNLHTNFKLSAGGEYLALVSPSGTVISEFGPAGSDYPSQSDDVSYGLHPSTEASVFFTSPTPGSANDAGGLARVEDTKFTPDRGYYQSAINVTIATDTVGAIIYYTTDGTPPIDSGGSPTANAVTFSGPIAISQTTPVRAAAVKTGFAPTNIDAHTYVLLDIDNANTDGTDTAGLNTPFLQQTQPAGWGNLTSGDYNMDTNVSKETGTASGHATSTAQTMLQGMRDIPTISIALDRDDFSGSNGIYTNSESKGFAWERACSAEFIPASGDTRGDWQENCGLRVQGGASRIPSRSPKHSLSFRFRADYGEGKLREAIFPDSQVEEFNVIALRAGYNNSWIHSDSGQRSRGSMIRDQWMRQSTIDMGNSSGGEGFMAHVFINGLYWGVHNLCERADASHYAAHNGGEEDLLDSRNGSQYTDGNSTAWNEIAGVVSGGDWAKIQQVIDIDQYIDYQIINKYGGNNDLKTSGNWRGAGGGPFPGGSPEQMAAWELYSWDGERTLEGQTQSSTPLDPMGVRGTLEGNPEYLIRFADRLQKHFFNEGALTPTKTASRWAKYAADLDRAIIAESARWGDHRGTLYTRDNQWLTEQNRLYTSYFPVRTTNVFNNYSSLFPSVDAPVFTVNGSNQHGGEIPSGGTLSATATSGTIYYTTDGTDPRLEGGAISGSASSTLPISLSGSGLVRMRARSGSTWSALDEAVFYIEQLADPGDLVVSEVHYNPYPATATEDAAGALLSTPRSFSSGDFEFIEVVNISANTLNLDGVTFTEGISGSFGITAVAPGASAVIVKDAEAFAIRYPSVTISGTYTGSLADGGEQIVFINSGNSIIQDFTYDNSGQWPGRPDGNGSSLEAINTAGDYSSPDTWRASSEFNGSPTTAGAGPDGRIVINEVLSHTDLPQTDSIEIYNATGSGISIGGWIISDNNSVYPSFRLPAATIGAGQYLSYTEADFNAAPSNAVTSYSGTLAAAPTTVTDNGHGLSTGDTITIEGYGGTGTYNDTWQVTVINANTFTIDTAFLDNHSTKGSWAQGRPFGLSSSKGETLWLLETDVSGNPTRFVDVVDFAAAFNGEALGRWPNGAGTGTLISMTSDTLGFENLGAQIGPVVISEVMYHPNQPAEDFFEYVEICNSGSTTENLANWKLRGGADFDFTASHSLAPGEALVVVAFDPVSNTSAATAFRNEYNIDGTITLVGPFTDGPLDNATGTVRLQRPDSPPAGDPGFYPQVTEDEVIYSSTSPWPTAAGGSGSTLDRLPEFLFGNFATSWTANLPTPGGKTTNYDLWSEAAFGPGNPPNSGENEDYDGDTIPNLLEFALGMNPLVSDPELIPGFVIEGPNATMTFGINLLVPGLTYIVQSSPDLINWTPVPDSQISVSNYTEIRKASVALPATGDFYLRLVVID